MPLYALLCMIYFIILSINQTLSSMMITQYYQRYHENLIYLTHGEREKEKDNYYTMFLDLTSQYSWICPNKSYKPRERSLTQRTIREDIQFLYKNFTYKAIEAEDQLTIIDQAPLATFNISFYFISEDQGKSPNNLGDGSLGFAYNFSNENHSLMHRFKQLGYIEHMSFAILTFGKISFGGIPLEYTLNKTHSHCNVLGLYSNWNCIISEVSFENSFLGKKGKYVNKSVVTFISDMHLNYVPKSFFDYLVNDYFKNEIAQKNIKIGKMRDFKQIYYIGEYSYVLDNITFTIGDYDYKISLRKFWECYDGYCDLDMIENPNGDEWVLGGMFFGAYSALFDHEEGKIHFYSSKGVSLKKEDNEDGHSYLHIKWLCVILITLLVTGAGLALIGRLALINKSMSINI